MTLKIKVYATALNFVLTINLTRISDANVNRIGRIKAVKISSKNKSQKSYQIKTYRINRIYDSSKICMGKGVYVA